MKFSVCLFLLLNYYSFSQHSYTDSVQNLRNEHVAELLDPANQILTETEIAQIRSLAYFPVDEHKKVNAVFTEEKGKKFQLPTSSGVTKTYLKYGFVTFTWKNETVRLNVYQDVNLAKKAGYEDYLLIPFKDATSGKETYGGGRYLDLRIPKTTGIQLDFNLAYNPYCAYSHRYSCPIPPSENHLTISMDAGEKTPEEH
ncbi:MAG: DUF1684 domain-containing protein [Crocinitomicaceae bacterium]|nr:DUF1684 domain-containing protein [Crocinitomicaceae bacterium]NGF76594.1 DUF1684 domain-containing protein [Fluviicola sp. SGL-29]